MYDGIKRIEDVIEYIEANLTGTLDFDQILSKVTLSLYEFRRVFSFVVGCPVSEYIRKRKLSLAALDILSEKNPDILKISEKYGYANQSSFSRAFSEHHGIAPTACLNREVQINLFTRPRFEFRLAGRESVLLKLISSDAFSIHGFTSSSPLTDSCCCDDVWTAFFESPVAKENTSPFLYVSYDTQGEQVQCSIGKRGVGQDIPCSRWACFAMNTVDDAVVNKKYSEILYELLPSAGLTRNESVPTIEVFPADMSQDGFEWEIWIPIHKSVRWNVR